MTPPLEAVLMVLLVASAAPWQAAAQEHPQHVVVLARFQEDAGEPVPGQEVPGQEIPGQEVPGQEIPGQEIPGQEIPGQEIPGQEVPGQEVPGQEVPGQEIPGQEIPGQEVPGQEIPGQEIPGQEIPGQEESLPPEEESLPEDDPLPEEEPLPPEEEPLPPEEEPLPPEEEPLPPEEDPLLEEEPLPPGEPPPPELSVPRRNYPPVEEEPPDEPPETPEPPPPQQETRTDRWTGFGIIEELEGRVAAVDLETGELRLEWNGGSVTLHGTPTQLRRYGEGETVTVDVKRYGSSRWLVEWPGTPGTEVATEVESVEARVARVDPEEGVLELAGTEMRNLKAHPLALRPLRPGQMVSVSYETVEGARWIASISERAGGAPDAGSPEAPPPQGAPEEGAASDAPAPEAGEAEAARSTEPGEGAP